MAGIRIGFREFRSKKDAKSFVREIVAAYSNGFLLSSGHFLLSRAANLSDAKIEGR